MIVFPFYIIIQIQNNWTYGEVLDENAKTHPMLRPYKTFSEKVRFETVTIVLCEARALIQAALIRFSGLILITELSFLQDKEIYRWPIKESIKAMLAWEWTLEKARDGEGEVEKKAATRKISQTAQVKRTK